jgi:ParB-like chromosome segregation protein Spo0J
MTKRKSKTPTMASRLELWPLERLQPYERNARTHSERQLEQIAASIQEFGFTAPILVDGQDGILAGHGRLEAARRLGLAQVPVVVLDHLTPEQRRAYVLADNRLALQSGWDLSILEAELESLQVDGFDVDLLGFDVDELSKMLGGEFDGADDDDEGDDDVLDRGVALAIVLTPEEMNQWRQAKAELGFSKDKTAFWKLVEDFLEEVRHG